MSFRGMLRHRVTVKRLTESNLNGMPVHSWAEVATDVECFLDLNFIRKGKDPSWTPEAGRPADRSGVGFFLGGAPIKNGDRVKVTKGPTGTFQLDMAVDQAWRPTAMHHLEAFCREVPNQIEKGST